MAFFALLIAKCDDFQPQLLIFMLQKSAFMCFFMSENQWLKFQIVAFSSSKCTYGLDFEDSGGFGLCLHIADVRDIIWKFVFKCDDVEFRKLKKRKVHEKRDTSY